MLPSTGGFVRVLFTVSYLHLLVYAIPQNRGFRNGNGRGRTGNTAAAQQATAQQQAAQIPQGVSQATDGSTVIDMTANINNLPIRFKISAPLSQYTTSAPLPPNTQATLPPNTPGPMGSNVLLHGDGGQSFFAFPKQATTQSKLIGVAVLAPDPNLFWGGGAGLQRTDGVAHAQAVSDLVTTVLPETVAFNSSEVFFTGVSGGSLLLSGFFVPAQMSAVNGAGVMLMCGALAPQVDFVDAGTVMRNVVVHYQSTKAELAHLQESIPVAIRAYEDVAVGAGLSVDEINACMTVDNSPQGGHCEFDGRGFESGVQVMVDGYANVMLAGGNGEVQGVGNVLTGVVGNENLQFDAVQQ